MKNITYSSVIGIAETVGTVHTHTHTHTHTGSLNIKNKINRSITIFLFLIIFIILNTGNSKAVLQANGNGSAIYNISDWMLNVRRMEELGGAMGLTETLNSNLTSSSESNNIDVHMEKNTEYGALVILSASSYGNPNKVEDGNTTTGNATGVLMYLNSEWVASGTVVSATNYYNAKSRYKNVCTDQYVAKKGDAISETVNWHGSKKNAWIYDNIDYGLLRARVGSIFSYYGTSNNDNGAYYIYEHPTRAVVVSGQGL